MKQAFYLSALMLLFALGCGGGNSSSSTMSQQTATPENITGNWDITANSVTGTSITIGGSIVSSGSSVTGVLHILNSSCFNIGQDVDVSGTITAGTNAVSLTSSPVLSQVITVNAVAGTSSSLSGGTYSISGGCANLDHGTLTGFIVPSFSNTYSGSFVSVSGANIGVTVALTQSPSPDADGLFHVTGTATFTGSPCFTSGTISNSDIAGGNLVIVLNTSDGGQTQFAGNITDSTGKSVTGGYEVLSGSCSSDSGSGSLSHG